MHEFTCTEHASQRSKFWLPAESDAGCDPMADCNHLQQAWRRSQRTLESLRQALHDAYSAGRLPAEIVTVAVSGSLGRMEQVPDSDCDLVVVSRELDDDRHARQLVVDVWSQLKSLQLPTPKSDGIYAGACDLQQLGGTADMGRIDESMHVFGNRIQLLLDCQPVFGTDGFDTTIRCILARYARDYIELDDHHQWTYLLNDTQRYFRSLCVNCQWASREQPGLWRSRNLKLRFSRLVNIASLLLLLGQSSAEPRDRLSWLAARLKMTPLERIAWVYAVHGDNNFPIIAQAYDEFLARFADPQWRRALDDNPPLAVDGEHNRDQTAAQQSPASHPRFHPLYRELKKHGREISRELVRFSLARQHDWHQQFFEYWLF